MRVGIQHRCWNCSQYVGWAILFLDIVSDLILFMLIYNILIMSNFTNVLELYVIVLSFTCFRDIEWKTLSKRKEPLKEKSSQGLS